VQRVGKVVITSMKKPSLRYFFAISLKSVIISISFKNAVVKHTKMFTTHAQSIKISVNDVDLSTCSGPIQILKILCQIIIKTYV
jgi:hypothetical protein